MVRGMQTLINAPTLRPPPPPTHPSLPPLARDDVMTASEVADLLQLPVSTVYYLAEGAHCAVKLTRPQLQHALTSARGCRSSGRARCWWPARSSGARTACGCIIHAADV
jgi:hypothetical protein